jgi:hypothetical protein
LGDLRLPTQTRLAYPKSPSKVLSRKCQEMKAMEMGL